MSSACASIQYNYKIHNLTTDKSAHWPSKWAHKTLPTQSQRAYVSMPRWRRWKQPLAPVHPNRAHYVASNPRCPCVPAQCRKLCSSAVWKPPSTHSKVSNRTTMARYHSNANYMGTNITSPISLLTSHKPTIHANQPNKNIGYNLDHTTNGHQPNPGQNYIYAPHTWGETIRNPPPQLHHVKVRGKTLCGHSTISQNP